MINGRYKIKVRFPGPLRRKGPHQALHRGPAPTGRARADTQQALKKRMHLLLADAYRVVGRALRRLVDWPGREQQGLGRAGFVRGQGQPAGRHMHMQLPTPLLGEFVQAFHGGIPHRRATISVPTIKRLFRARRLPG